MRTLIKKITALTLIMALLLPTTISAETRYIEPTTFLQAFIVEASAYYFNDDDYTTLYGRNYYHTAGGGRWYASPSGQTFANPMDATASGVVWSEFMSAGENPTGKYSENFQLLKFVLPADKHGTIRWVGTPSRDYVFEEYIITGVATNGRVPFMIIDGVLVVDTDMIRGEISVIDDPFEWARYYNPTGTANNLTKTLGDPLNQFEGITGRWGYTTSRDIWSDGGEIVTQNLTDISTNGTTYNRLGILTQNVRLRDGHSLSTEYTYQYDNTLLDLSRQVRVTTPLAPDIYATFAPGSLRYDGTPIPAGTRYQPNESGTIFCEDGWTNQALDLWVMQRSGWSGDFTRHMNLQGSMLSYSVKDNDSKANIEGYHTNTPVGGRSYTGALVSNTSATDLFTSTATALVKIDKTPPIPAVIHEGDFVFKDDSSDDLSGLSEVAGRESKIYLAPVSASSTPPAENLFYKFDEIPTGLALGSYDIWVMAVDKAGNKAIVKVLPNYSIAPEVIISKYTPLAERATTHEAECPNHASATELIGCLPECETGTKYQVGEGAQIRYAFMIKNNSTTDVATIAFKDVLPAGLIPGIHSTGSPSAIKSWSIVNGIINATFEVNPGATVYITQQGTIPAYDNTTGASNVISNQASFDYVLDKGGSNEREGGGVTEYVNHKIMPPEVRVQKSTALTSIGTVHEPKCPNHASATKDESKGCLPLCGTGTNYKIDEGSRIHYMFWIYNDSTTDVATIDLEDVLPAGLEYESYTSTRPDYIKSFDENNGTINATLELQPYAENEGVIMLRVTCLTPAYDDTAGATNVTSNQASFAYKMDKGGTGERGGTGLTQYINNEIVKVEDLLKITKETDKGGTTHTHDCANKNSATVVTQGPTPCGSECADGAQIELLPGTEFTYIITLKNEFTDRDLRLDFMDQLPDGLTFVRLETVPTNLTATSHSLSSDSTIYWEDLLINRGQTIQIKATYKVPAFRAGAPNNNVLSNGFSASWGKSGDAKVKTAYTNYVNHSIKPGVETKFTKVGSNALTTGLVGTEFKLYKWDDPTAPTTQQANHIVDTTNLTDGKWKQVGLNGEDAPFTITRFTSDASGLVDMGRLPDGVYTLIETKSAAGYELPVGQWIVTIDNAKLDSGANDWKITYVGKSDSILPPAVMRDGTGTAVAYRLVNAKPFVIGMSGMSGTHVITILGLAIMILATSVYIILDKKKKKEKKN